MLHSNADDDVYKGLEMELVDVVHHNPGSSLEFNFPSCGPMSGGGHELSLRHRNVDKIPECLRGYDNVEVSELPPRPRFRPSPNHPTMMSQGMGPRRSRVAFAIRTEENTPAEWARRELEEADKRTARIFGGIDSDEHDYESSGKRMRAASPQAIHESPEMSHSPVDLMPVEALPGLMNHDSNATLQPMASRYMSLNDSNSNHSQTAQLAVYAPVSGQARGEPGKDFTPVEQLKNQLLQVDGRASPVKARRTSHAALVSANSVQVDLSGPVRNWSPSDIVYLKGEVDRWQKSGADERIADEFRLMTEERQARRRAKLGGSSSSVSSPVSVSVARPNASMYSATSTAAALPTGPKPKRKRGRPSKADMEERRLAEERNNRLALERRREEQQRRELQQALAHPRTGGLMYFASLPHDNLVKTSGLSFFQGPLTDSSFSETLLSVLEENPDLGMDDFDKLALDLKAYFNEDISFRHDQLKRMLKEHADSQAEPVEEEPEQPKGKNSGAAVPADSVVDRQQQEKQRHHDTSGASHSNSHGSHEETAVRSDDPLKGDQRVAASAVSSGVSSQSKKNVENSRPTHLAPSPSPPPPADDQSPSAPPAGEEEIRDRSTGYDGVVDDEDFDVMPMRVESEDEPELHEKDSSPVHHESRLDALPPQEPVDNSAAGLGVAPMQMDSEDEKDENDADDRVVSDEDGAAHNASDAAHEENERVANVSEPAVASDASALVDDEDQGASVALTGKENVNALRQPPREAEKIEPKPVSDVFEYGPFRGQSNVHDRARSVRRIVFDYESPDSWAHYQVASLPKDYESLVERVQHGQMQTVSEPRAAGLDALLAEEGVSSALLREIQLLRNVNSAHLEALSSIYSGPPLELEFRRELRLSEVLGVSQVSFSAAAVKTVALQILHGLYHLHSIGLVHGNLCVENVLCCEGNQIRLGDWFRARGSMKNDSSVRLSAAPEVVFMGHEPTTASDMWSLGTVLGAMFMRRPIFTGTSLAEQLQSMVRLLGTPDHDCVGDSWDKLRSEYVSVVSPYRSGNLRAELGKLHLDAHWLAFFERLLKYASAQRSSALRHLKHSFFCEIAPRPDPSHLPDFARIPMSRSDGVSRASYSWNPAYRYISQK